jgi:hypothetical protein
MSGIHLKMKKFHSTVSACHETMAPVGGNNLIHSAGIC